jgi:UDP-glucose 4-epimerase
MDLSTGTILVTGGSGYIGIHTVRSLRRAGVPVVALDRRAAPPAVQLLGSAFERIDVRDTGGLTRVLREHAVTAVVHCAGRKSAPESLRAPDVYFDDNVRGTLSLLQAMLTASVTSIVFSSSCAVYGHPAELPISESAPLQPLTPYAETKLQAERLLYWFGISYGLRHVSLRTSPRAVPRPTARVARTSPGPRICSPSRWRRPGTGVP